MWVNDLVDRYEPQGAGRSGLYVDLENLHAGGQAMVQDLVESWPAQAPPPSRLMLYVRADQVELWRLWATGRYPELEVGVSGTQHFSQSASKNSADIAMATHAMADLALRRVDHVVVFSDDSDFISLYVAIRDEPGIPRPGGRAPFLWVVTDRQGSLSATVRQFFPPDHLHVIAFRGPGSAGTAPAAVSPSADAPAGPPGKDADIWVAMARAVLGEIGVGQFKSADCQGIIRQRWPGLRHGVQEQHLAGPGGLGSADQQPREEAHPLRDDGGGPAGRRMRERIGMPPVSPPRGHLQLCPFQPGLPREGSWCSARPGDCAPARRGP